MPKHSGGKVGNAGKVLSSPKSTSNQKSNAAKTLNNHKNKHH